MKHPIYCGTLFRHYLPEEQCSPERDLAVDKVFLAGAEGGGDGGLVDLDVPGVAGAAVVVGWKVKGELKVRELRLTFSNFLEMRDN